MHKILNIPFIIKFTDFHYQLHMLDINEVGAYLKKSGCEPHKYVGVPLLTSSY